MDPEYVAARKVLLDALEALESHRAALILVGAQAVYVWTGPAGLAVAEHTTDADICIDRRVLRSSPNVAAAMRKAGFRLDRSSGGEQVGLWCLDQEVDATEPTARVDLLVPEAISLSGKGGARLGAGHDRETALAVHGLEASLVDKKDVLIGAFEESDPRVFTIAVARPAALLVAKAHKLNERLQDAAKGRLRRPDDKDALDVLRILAAVDIGATANTLRELAVDPVAGRVTRDALGFLADLFAAPDSPGSQMAARAAFPERAETIAMSCAALMAELLAAVGH